MSDRDFRPFEYDSKTPEYVLEEYRALIAGGKPAGGDDLKFYNTRLMNLEFALVEKSLVRYPEADQVQSDGVSYKSLTTERAIAYAQARRKTLIQPTSH